MNRVESGCAARGKKPPKQGGDGVLLNLPEEETALERRPIWTTWFLLCKGSFRNASPMKRQPAQEAAPWRPFGQA